jgi:hypothetical protein
VKPLLAMTCFPSRSVRNRTQRLVSVGPGHMPAAKAQAVFRYISAILIVF